MLHHRRRWRQQQVDKNVALSAFLNCAATLTVKTPNIMTLCIIALSIAMLQTKVQQSWQWNTARVIWMIVVRLNVAAPLKLFSDFDFCQKCFIWRVFSLQSHFVAGFIISKLNKNFLSSFLSLWFILKAVFTLYSF